MSQRYCDWATSGIYGIKPAFPLDVTGNSSTIAINNPPNKTDTQILAEFVIGMRTTLP